MNRDPQILNKVLNESSNVLKGLYTKTKWYLPQDYNVGLTHENQFK